MIGKIYEIPRRSKFNSNDREVKVILLQISARKFKAFEIDPKRGFISLNRWTEDSFEVAPVNWKYLGRVYDFGYLQLKAFKDAD